MAASVFHKIVRALWFVLQWMILPRNHPCSWFSHWHDSAGWWKTGCKIQLFVFLSFHAVFFQKSLFITVNALNLHHHLQEQMQYGVDGGTISNATRIVRYELQVSSTLEMRYLVLTTKRWGAVDDRKTTSNIQKKSLKPGLENREGVKRKAK